jgi:hypothetical protein
VCDEEERRNNGDDLSGNLYVVRRGRAQAGHQKLSRHVPQMLRAHVERSSTLGRQIAGNFQAQRTLNERRTISPAPETPHRDDAALSGTGDVRLRKR